MRRQYQATIVAISFYINIGLHHISDKEPRMILLEKENCMSDSKIKIKKYFLKITLAAYLV